MTKLNKTANMKTFKTKQQSKASYSELMSPDADPCNWGEIVKVETVIQGFYKGG